jgi:hypothetical protein
MIVIPVAVFLVFALISVVMAGALMMILELGRIIGLPFYGLWKLYVYFRDRRRRREQLIEERAAEVRELFEHERVLQNGPQAW